MIKTLTRHGNSLALIIDKPILELLKIGADSRLEIRTDDGKSLVITPIDDGGRADRLAQSLEKINERHHEALRKLGQ